MSISKNLNYLKNLWRHPCATPNIEIVIETAFEAFFPALYEVIGIGCTDIIKLRAGKAPWHGRNIRAIAKAVHVPEAVGKNIYRYSVPYLAVEAGLWYWMVIDVASGFLPNWASLMYQESGCDLPRNGYIETEVGIGPKFPGGPYRCLLGNPSNKGCVRFIGDECMVARGCSATVTYDVTPVEHFPGIFGPGIAEFWLEDADGNTSPVNTWDSRAVQDGKARGGGINKARATTTGELSVVLNMRVLSGVVSFSGGHMRASGYGRPFSLIAGGCKPRPVEYPWAG